MADENAAVIDRDDDKKKINPRKGELHRHNVNSKWAHQELASAQKRQLESTAYMQQSNKTTRNSGGRPETGLTHSTESCQSAFSCWW